MVRILNVEVMCPSTSRSYDYKIPPSMKAGDVKKRIISDIRLYEGLPDLFSEEENIGIYCENNCRLGDDISLGNAGVKSGDRLMII